jgi:hypothetical protein
MDASVFFSALADSFAYFGILACLTALAGMLLPIPFYSGRAGEKYSMLNHFVSELGEAGVSRGARVFNGCLIAAGACFLPFILGLGFAVGDVWAYLAMVTGLWTAVSLMLIGVYSMDKIEPHIRAAMSFFDAGFLTVILFTVGIWAQPAGAPAIPRAAGWIGVLCILINGVFLAGNPRPPAGAEPADFLRPDFLKDRPRIWSKPILEWLVVLTSILWYLATALTLALR